MKSILSIQVLLITLSISAGCRLGSNVSADKASQSAYVIKSVLSGNCMDVPASRTNNGIVLQQFPCNGTKAQLFQFSGTDNGYVLIQSSLSDKVLEAQNQGASEGTPIQQWDSNRGDHQQFKVVQKGQGTFAIINRASGLALSIRGQSRDLGAKLELTKDNGDVSQLWSLESPGGNSGPVVTSPAPTGPTQSQGRPVPTQVPTPAPGGNADAALKAACRPTRIDVINGENEAFKIYSNAIPNPSKTLADIAETDCLALYKTASEVRRRSTITIHIHSFDGVANASPSSQEGLINLSADYLKSFARNSNADAIKQEVMGVMVHEINHLYQNFWQDGQRFTPLSEGVCDAIRARAGFYPPGRKIKGGNYLGSYTTTGYFLLYLDEKYPDFIHDINQAALSWNDNFWAKKTGKSVDQLWSEYQNSF